MVWRNIVKYVRQLGDYLGIRSRDDDAARQARVHYKVFEISDLLRNEDWATLRLHFSPLVRWFLPESVLRTGFDTLRLTTGPIVHVGTPIISVGWLTTTAKLPVQFKHVRMAMVLQMTAHDRLFGPRFWPQRLHGFGSPWRNPTYVVAAASASASASALWDETIVQLGPSPKLKVTGTLTIPRKPGRYPCIVMLPGSGPCDRDSSVEAAKPFKDLALGLAILEVATLRFDKVTFTHGNRVRSRKDFTLTDEYMDHAESAVRHCYAHDRVLRDGVFLLGHSLGGYITPHLTMVELYLAGCILMASPATPLYWSALRQLRYLADMEASKSESSSSSSSITTTTAARHIKDFQCKAELADGPDLQMSTPASQLPFGIGPAYWLDFRNYTPITTCQRLGKPILIAQGGRDYQVTVTDDYEKWVQGLEDTTADVTFRLYEHLNHLFIAGQGLSTPLEYDVPGNVDYQVVRDIGEWVVANCGRPKSC